jgi:predicted secreted Zn-dependent protease
MRRIISASALCALAVGLVVAPGAIGKAGPKQVSGTVSVLVSPNPVPSTATSVTASGNVGASSNCRKDRTIHFQYVNTTTGVVEPLAVTVVTRPNGDYSATLPRPAPPTPPATLPQTYVVQATVDQAERLVGSKKKGKKKKRGRQFVCLQTAGQSSPVTFSAPPPPPGP